MLTGLRYRVQQRSHIARKQVLCHKMEKSATFLGELEHTMHREEEAPLIVEMMERFFGVVGLGLPADACVDVLEDGLSNVLEQAKLFSLLRMSLMANPPRDKLQPGI